MNNTKYLTAAYDAARQSGLAHSVTDFANLIGVDRSTMSSALNGSERNATDKLVQRVEKILKLNIIVVTNGGDVVGIVTDKSVGIQKNFNQSPEKNAPSIERLLDEMKAQRESYTEQIAQLLKIITNLTTKK